MRSILLWGLFSALFTIGAIAQKDLDKVKETVTKPGVEAKVQFLASDEMKGRDTPSPQLDLGF